MHQASAKSDLHNEAFDSIIDAFIEDTGLTGATVAILEDDRLVYAAGKGNIRGHSAMASTLVPILELSKLITAVAILQLYEAGRIHLQDRVFGNHRLLYFIKPTSGKMDARLHHITVEHLLHHTAGWDEGVRPLYDPTINPLFVKRGFDVVDIAKEMQLFGIPNQDDIIHFMVNQPVANKPGSVKKHSNFGYCILGRIIEEVTGLTYEEYVRRNILEPSGMWKTRIGPQPTQTYQSQMPKTYDDISNLVNDDIKKGYIPLGDEKIKSLFDSVPAEVLDSTLGWHSTVYDMARFFTSLMKRGEEGLLKPETLEVLFLPTRLTDPADVDEDRYQSMIFTVEPMGSYWQSSRNYDVGITEFFFHKPSTTGYSTYFAQSSAGKSNEMTLFFFGVTSVSNDKLGSLVHQIMKPLLITDSPMDGYLTELVDSHYKQEDVDVAVVHRLSEHRLYPHIEAMRISGYYPTWLHANCYASQTHFSIIYHKATEEKQLDFDIAIHSDKVKTSHYIKRAIDEGYQVTLLQSYRSEARGDHLAHLVLVTRVVKPMVSLIELDVSLNKYFELHDSLSEEGFIPAVQSIEETHGELKASFLLNQATDDNQQIIKTQHRAYTDLTIQQLETIAKANAESNFHLVHLDTHTIDEANHFSAIFYYGSAHDWFLQTQLESDEMKMIGKNWEEMGYVPKILVSYKVSDAEDVKYICLWVLSHSTSPQQ